MKVLCLGDLCRAQHLEMMEDETSETEKAKQELIPHLELIDKLVEVLIDKEVISNNEFIL